MRSPRDTLQRRIVPRAVVALSTVRRPRRLAAVVRRAVGGRVPVRLYVAFDDPASAIAAVGLSARLAGRRARLIIEPVVARGIPGDPAAEAKRRYAVVDAARLARRDGRELARAESVTAESAAFLADWASAAPTDVQRTAFSVAALRRLWFESDGRVEPEDFRDLWRMHGDGDPPSNGAGAARRAERGMRLRRLYDTPVAVVAGQWFFAHERLDQIEHALDELGWVAAG